MGDSEFLAFMAPEGVEGVELPPEDGMITHHIAFEVDDPEALNELHDRLLAEGIKVSDVVVHDWCQSIYFDDPVNRIRLEACTTTRELDENDARIQERFSVHAEQVQEPAVSRATYHELIPAPPHALDGGQHACGAAPDPTRTNGAHA